MKAVPTHTNTGSASAQMLVSVIMPAYNAGKYIDEAIKSILNQTYKNWELVIVDDASDDATAEIVGKYIHDSRIQYFRSERIGHPAGVRNAALYHARGDLLAFLDADDLYMSTALEVLAREMELSLTATAVYGFPRYIGDDGHFLRQQDLLEMSKEGKYTLPQGYSHEWQRLVLGDFSCLLPAMMLRRSTLLLVGNFNETLCGPEDFEFYLRLFLLGRENVKIVPEYIYFYRQHSESLTKSPEHCFRVLESALQVIEWLFKQRGMPAPIYHLKSLAFGRRYHYAAREQLLSGQVTLCRSILGRAAADPRVTIRVWIALCLPLLVRSALPREWNHRLVAIRQSMRRRYARPATTISQMPHYSSVLPKRARGDNARSSQAD